MTEQHYRAECVCGWSIQRDARQANLPRANNKRITQTVASMHESRPRFGERADETHVVTFRADHSDPDKQDKT